MPQDASAAVPVLDDKVEYALERLADIHACFGLGDAPMTRDEVRMGVRNAAYLMLTGTGMSNAAAGEILRRRFDQPCAF